MKSLMKVIMEAKTTTKKWEDYDTIKCPDGTIIDMQKLINDVEIAKAAVIHQVPEFGGLLDNLKIVYTFQVSTQATDGCHLFINPQFTMKELDTPTKKFAVMLHELMHCLLQHMRRGRGHDHEKSNIAADYEVNSTLVDLDLVKESTWKEIEALYDKQYQGMGYEAIYAKNPKGPRDDAMTNNNSSMSNQSGEKQSQGNTQDQPQSGSQGSSGGDSSQDDSQDGSQNQSQSGSGSSSSSSSQQQSQNGSGGGGSSSSSQQQSQNGSKGGGSQNQSQNGSQKQSQKGASGGKENSRDDGNEPGKNQGVVTPEDCAGQAQSELKDTPGTAGGMIDKKSGDKIAEEEGYDKEPGNDDSIDKQWEKDAQKVANNIANKQHGKGGAWGKFVLKINRLTKVTTDWKKALARVVGRSLSDETFRRSYANKNALVRGELMQTNKDKFDNITDIVAMIDTSGSMSDAYKAACLKQVFQVANQKKPCRMVIIPFDDGPKDVFIYNNVDKLYNDIKGGKLKIRGGGGTDVRPCFKMLETDKRFKTSVFELIMIFTDGYLEQVKRNKRYVQNLCWVIADNPNWQLEYKDAYTYRIFMDTNDFK